MTTGYARPRTTAVRRAALLLLLVAGLIVGSSLPSWATFADEATVSATVQTATVAPPTNLRATTTCTDTYVTVKLAWTASTSARVSGYRIRVHFGGGAYQDQTTVGPTTTTWQGTTYRSYTVNYTMTFTVWTLTDYGWSAESAHTPRIVC
ncbi:hypothetical protein [Blastococcus deserti]|uniref:Fibronectin type-III domain-containing protein n=1 Tax=Blastococcus deserti TaxID=2259033 RepID=A0ABW4X5R7_9ACTN